MERLRSTLHPVSISSTAHLHFLQVLNISWNIDKVRDTALYYPLRKQVGITQEGVYPSLKVLAEKVLGKTVQVGEHSSESIFAAMDFPLLVFRPSR
jgi:hypothetical protein